MTCQDPLSNLFTRIRNAKDAMHRFVDMNSSKILLEILKVLKDQGYLENYLVDAERKKMRIFLKYAGGRAPVLNEIKRISKPGLRRYVSVKKIPTVQNGFGIAILSTPMGILDGETARKENVGGELLCTVW
ncbi:MAG: 30S ribosomal protein S8 [Chlamydiae bacterium RIFCSPHIGHO2_02_FULL_49_29]|uniref:Small ribosomal subunit protein uS8 n=1 Tax=uncultured Chlamydiae bacterium Rifle_16ft_4_minimus_1822 TaxID=1665093 RepID=A0A0H4TLH2_9BACT|nr:30S ribosomal protein S8 [uncultured Chlamydiae bacterium Rifle_16ft_4_minimus_1822]OGN54077.1 MAG: 30S ribosomal protein S8 [Chlamydiae bacterium GWF2_49_8]OGN57906.1 MAG: 30S ribosomal protein S8 [Chlamydiae bacterium RIFCSPHIGHO2_02_FULL_49_29]